MIVRARCVGRQPKCPLPTHIDLRGCRSSNLASTAASCSAHMNLGVPSRARHWHIRGRLGDQIIGGHGAVSPLWPTLVIQWLRGWLADRPRAFGIVWFMLRTDPTFTPLEWGEFAHACQVVAAKQRAGAAENAGPNSRGFVLLSAETLERLAERGLEMTWPTRE